MKNKILKICVLILLLSTLIWFIRPSDRNDNQPAISFSEKMPISDENLKQAQPVVLNNSHEAKQILGKPRQEINSRVTNFQPVSSYPDKTDRHKSPPPHAVPYERKGDFVVAYGDVLLGKPSDPKIPSQGFIAAPPVSPWPNSEIPFSIHESVKQPDEILKVIEYMQRHTRIRFVPFSGQSDSIVFMPYEEHCLSYLGRVGGNQPIYLSPKCGFKEILHEIMHALGFIHEHTRPDRDRFVKVNWENIEPEMTFQFTIAPEEWAEPLSGRPFDYQSIMIYNSEAFSRDKQSLTLESITNSRIEPRSDGLSQEDLNRISALYF